MRRVQLLRHFNCANTIALATAAERVHAVTDMRLEKRVAEIEWQWSLEKNLSPNPALRETLADAE